MSYCSRIPHFTHIKYHVTAAKQVKRLSVNTYLGKFSNLLWLLI
jgi:hypothetical protein